MNPPLRTQEDIDAIIEGFKDGTLDCIATDHAPHASYEKEQEFDKAPFGIVGIETMLGVALGVLGPHLSLPQIIEKMTSGAAGVLGLDAGTLQVGKRADVCVFDPDEKWIVDKNELASKSKNTPFDKCEMTGRVKATIVNGKMIQMQADTASHIPTK
jgi:dihydroorotase